MEIASAFLILALMTIAACVAYRLKKLKKDVWLWVVAYWVVLTIKNALDFAGGFFNGF